MWCFAVDWLVLHEFMTPSRLSKSVSLCPFRFKTALIRCLAPISASNTHHCYCLACHGEGRGQRSGSAFKSLQCSFDLSHVWTPLWSDIERDNKFDICEQHKWTWASCSSHLC